MKFKGITKNYGTIVRLENSAKDISFDRLGVKVLKAQAINFIRELAKQEGEIYAACFMQEEH